MNVERPPLAAVSWRRRLGVVLTAAALALLVTAQPADAHNVFRSSNPADKTTVDRVPSEVVLTFDGPAIALGTKLVVTGPSGEIQQGDARLVDNTVRQSLAGGAPAGDYTVVWRVTSVDGHPLSGKLAFAAKSAGEVTTGSAEPEPGPPAAAPLSLPTGWILAGGLFILALGTVVVLAIRRRR